MLWIRPYSRSGGFNPFKITSGPPPYSFMRKTIAEDTSLDSGRSVLSTGQASAVIPGCHPDSHPHFQWQGFEDFHPL